MFLMVRETRAPRGNLRKHAWSTQKDPHLFLCHHEVFFFVFMKQLLYELLQNFVHTLIFSLDELL